MASLPAIRSVPASPREKDFSRHQRVLMALQSPRLNTADVFDALIIAVFLASVSWLTFLRNLQDVYLEPIAGTSALHGMPKAPDLAAFKVFFVTFCSTLLLRVWHRRSKNYAIDERRNYVQCMIALPGVVGLVAFLWTGRYASATYLIPFVGWSFWITRSSWRRWSTQLRLVALLRDDKTKGDWLRDGSLILLCAFAAAMGFGIAWLRGRPGSPEAALKLTTWTGWGLSGIGIAVALLAQRLQKRALFTAWIALLQLAVPLCALAFLPAPAFDGIQRYIPYARLPHAYVATIGFMAVSYGSMLYRAGSFLRRGSLPERPTLFIGAWASFVLLLCMSPHTLQGITIDDYHFGELLLPWQQWRDFHSLPYADMVPSHGLLQFMQGWIADWMFDGSAAAVASVGRMLGGLAGVVLFLIVAQFVPCGWAVALMAALSCAPSSGTEFYAPFAFMLACSHPSLLRRPRTWSVFWAIAGLGMALTLLIQGTACWIGSLVSAMVPLRRMNLHHGMRYTFSWSVGLLIGVTCLIYLTGIAPVLLGALAHVRDNSGINALAYGIPLGVGGATRSHVLWNEILTNWQLLWIPAAAVSGAGAWLARTKKWNLPRSSLPLLWASTAIALLVMHGYALGRIDPNCLTRTGSVTLFVSTLLLPTSVLLLCYKSRPEFAAACLCGMICFGNGGQHLWLQVIDHVKAQSLDLQQDTSGLNLGAAKVDNGHISNLVQLKTALDSLLASDETYLDLTNRNAQYFYLNRRSPLSVAAFYNAPSSSYQKRTLQNMMSNQPSAVLISGNNMIFDEVQASLRAPHLYRYFALHYIPLKIDQFSFLVTPEIAARTTSEAKGEKSADALTILDESFYRSDYGYLPGTWGRSVKSMEGRSLTAGWRPQDRDIQSEENESQLRIFLRKRSGDALQYLKLSIQCKSPTGRSLREEDVHVTWQTSGSLSNPTSHIHFKYDTGKLLVPLNASPKWLLAKDLELLSLRLPCKSWKLEDIIFLNDNGNDNALARQRI